mmetsp:Transcript_14322/g.22097  ORF Transcript_14322/g.22097 Transcript_14322/m.22097 type:complete len:122 (-) Transcript_14322:189-554(-)
MNHLLSGCIGVVAKSSHSFSCLFNHLFKSLPDQKSWYSSKKQFFTLKTPGCLLPPLSSQSDSALAQTLPLKLNVNEIPQTDTAPIQHSSSCIISHTLCWFLISDSGCSHVLHLNSQSHSVV